LFRSIQVTAENIKKLKIQGARNVALAAIESLENLAERAEARDRKAFLRELFEAEDVLFASRDTEPLMRNAIR
jgi:translation initiation factor 2B subunit (eIF-2B alpha/beta/delta family)